MNADALVILLGKSDSAEDVRSLLRRFGKSLEIDSSSRSVRYYQFPELGFCICYDVQKDAVSNIFLYNQDVEGYSRFGGNLPGNVLFADNRSATHAKLGDPNQTIRRKPMVDPRAGDTSKEFDEVMRELKRTPLTIVADLYEVGDFLYHFEFDELSSETLMMVTLGLIKYYPSAESENAT
jgi:hypothetical protein